MIRSDRSVCSRNPRSGEVEKKDIKFRSETRFIRESSAMILDSLKSLGVDDSRAFEIKLCVEEAVRNAIVHGNKSDPKRQIKFSYWINDDTVNIEIEDEGSGFKPELIKDPTKDENLTRNSGRGVYLIKKLMDNVEYVGSGNKVRISKRLK